MTEDDYDLALAAGAGDRTAFRQLLERHYDTAYRVAYRYVGTVEDAEDIVQDVCAGLARKLKSFRGKSQFKTWLYSVVVNACRDHGRRMRTAQNLQANYAMYREMADADHQDDSRRVGWLGEALTRLEPKLRETAILVISEDLSHAEAATALGCAESTVSWRMHEVRKTLKSLVDGIDD